MRKIVFYTFLIATLFTSLSCKKEEKTEQAGRQMQNFVVNIATYAKSLNPNFFIIPQNGNELMYNDANPENGVNTDFLNHVDGWGNEEIFYNKKYRLDDYRLGILKQIALSKTVFTSDFVSDDSDVSDAMQKSEAQGFIPFVRTHDDYYYRKIPTNIPHENSNDITELSDVKNYLYLIDPSDFSSKADFVSKLQQTNFDLLIIDLFYNDEMLSNTDIQSLKTKANGGKRLVICYVNIGSAENYRYYWQSSWKLHHPSWLKKKYPGYKDEIYVEFWDEQWQNIIFGNNNSYLKKVLNAGFDGAYLDNVEAYYVLYH